MTESQNYSIKGDRALGTGDEDKLGFRDVAKRIAVSLVDRSTEDGLVIGLEGLWGSGKSSLLFLISDELKKLPEDRRPTVINFRPWLIGNRDALIYSLFGELSRQLDRVALNKGDATDASVTKAKKAGEALRSFVNGLSKTGALVEFVGKASGLGVVEMMGEGISSLGEATEGEAAAPPLSELKDKLSTSLRDLNHRFVVTIDDVDRLEPAEVIEILRLVRSVVDLPNMIYLLCYDGSILAHSIEQAAGVKSGQAYLEKIVQLTVMVPKPEPLQLRQWFSEELHRFTSVKDEDERSRLEIVIDHEGGRQLRTPRSVVRALDAIRFFWPPLSQVKADLADLVWIQLIKDGNNKLYRWIEDYCATVSVISLGSGRIDEADRASTTEDLLSSVAADYFQNTIYRHYFSEMLPGVECDYSKNAKNLTIFCNIDEHERDKAIRARRLASPDHYRLYFALTDPSHVLKQEEFSEIWSAADNDEDKTGKILLALYATIASGTLSKADLLLERVKGGAYEVLSPTQCQNLLMAFANVMDQAYKERSFDLFWVGSLWDRAQSLIPLLVNRLENSQQEDLIVRMFETGKAIGWLTSLLRHETMAHGRHGFRQRPESEWLFTNDQFERVTTAMLTRYQSMSITDLLSAPNPVSMLFAWRQAGDDDGPRQLLERSTSSDQGLVEALEKLSSTIQSSHRGRFAVIKEENLSPFIDFHASRQRIENLIKHPDLDERAKQLMVRFRDGDEY